MAAMMAIILVPQVQAQPANDECVEALTLFVQPLGACLGNATSGDNTSATQSTTGPLCDPTTTGIYADVWYTFSSGPNTSITVDFDPGTMGDRVIVILDGCTGSEVDCSVTPPSSYVVAVQTMTEYWIRVYSNTQYGPGGQFSICLSQAGTPPPNDACSSVTTVPLAIGTPLLFQGDNTDATITDDVEPGTSLDDGAPKVWHGFTVGGCVDLTIGYCGTTPVHGSVSQSLATVCPLGATVVQSTTAGTANCLDGNWTLFFAALPPGTYYLPVNSSEFIGPYMLELNAVAACVPPPNDDCADAALVPVNLSTDCPANAVIGTTEYATDDGGMASCESDPGPYRDQWYQFNSGANLSITIDLQPITLLDWVLVVLDACNGNEVHCQVTPMAPVTIPVSASTDYWIRVYAIPTVEPGTFSLCVSGAAANGACEAGTVSGNGSASLTICKDGAADVAAFTTTSTSLENYAFLLTDDNDEIIAQLPGNSTDLNALALGDYHVWGVSYNGTLTGVTPGQPVSGIGTTGLCVDLGGSVLVSVQICAGVVENQARAWSIHPNPSDGEVTLRYGGSTGLFDLQLIDLTGRIVHSQRMELQQNATHKLSLAERPTGGMYILRLIGRDGSSERAIILQ